MTRTFDSELVRTTLRPASALYALVSRSRNLLYDRGLVSVKTLPVPVISIGNITVGGTGKTPLTIHIAQRLLEAGILPMILSRGYGSSGSGTRIVSEGRGARLGPESAGDEPVLMAERVPGTPVVVDPDRVRGGLEGIRRFHPGVILLDDGFQHRRLARQLDIVVLDAVDPFGRYAMLPAGRLRESFAGLARAGVFVITHAPSGEGLATMLAVLRRYNPHAPIVRADHRPESLVSALHLSALQNEPSLHDDAGRSAPGSPTGAPGSLRGVGDRPNGPGPAPGSPILGSGSIREMDDPSNGRPAARPLEVLRNASVFAFCGVGNPEGFRHTLQAAGARIAELATFRDHHRYHESEIRDLVARAEAVRADMIVTTEKDAVRLAGMPLADRILALRIGMTIDDEAPLMTAILKVIRR